MWQLVIPAKATNIKLLHQKNYFCPLSILNAAWEEISLDFVVRLPKSKGFDAVLVVVDRLSKYILIKPYSVKSIAEILAKEVVRLHGIPKSIVSDRDPTFLSHFWKELFRLQGIILKMSTAYQQSLKKRNSEEIMSTSDLIPFSNQ
jgi:hypothetical protein